MLQPLTHWGRVTHTCVCNLSIIGSDNGFAPSRSQAIIWTNAGILLIRSLGTHFREILNKIHTFSFKKMHLKTSSAKWRPSCLGLNVLNKQCLGEVRKLTTHWFLCYFQVCLLTAVRCYMNTLHNSDGPLPFMFTLYQQLTRGKIYQQPRYLFPRFCRRTQQR